MIIITGTVHVRPDDLDEMLALCVDHVQRSRAEPGCISHAVHRDVEDPARIFFYEEWVDAAAVRTHFAVPASGSFVTALTAVASSPPQMAIYDAAEAKV